jgi:hypothetical protein
MSSIAENYLSDLGRLVGEQAIAAKLESDAAQEPGDRRSPQAG